MRFIFSKFLKLFNTGGKFLWFWSFLFFKLFLGLSLFIFIALYILLFTEAGFGLVAKNVSNLLDDSIAFTYEAGHLGKGIHLKDVHIEIPEVITIESDVLNLDYRLSSLFTGDFRIQNVYAENLLLVVMGKKPEDMPIVADFLAERLYEVKSFIYDKDAEIVSRVRAEKDDSTVNIRPIPYESTENATNLIADSASSENLSTQDVENSAKETKEVSKDNSESISKSENHTDLATTLKTVDNMQKQAKSANKVPELLKDKNIKQYNDSFISNFIYAPSVNDLQKVNLYQNGGLDSDYKDLFENNSYIAEYNFAYKGNEKSSPLTLPILVTIENVEVKNFLLLIEEIDVAAEHVSLRADYKGDTLTAYDAKVTNIDVLLHNERFVDSEPTEEDKLLTSSAVKEVFNRDETIQKVTMLPTVILPFNIDLKSLEIFNGQYHMDGFSTNTFMAKLTGEFIGPHIPIHHFKFVHDLGVVELNDSEIFLTRYFPMKAHLHAYSHNTEWFGALDTHELDAEVEGDLVDLFVDANLVGIDHKATKAKTELNTEKSQPTTLNNISNDVQTEAQDNAKDVQVTKQDNEASKNIAETKAKDFKVNDALNVKARLSVLTPSLPFIAQIQGDNLMFPISSTPDVKAKNLTVHARGTLDAMSANVKALGVKALDLPKLDVNIQADTDLNAAYIRTLNVTQKNDNIGFDGFVTWEDIIKSNGQLQASIKNLADYNLGVTGNVAAKVAYKAAFKDIDSWNIAVTQLQADGKLNNNSLIVSSDDIDFNSNFIGKISKLHLQNGSDNIVNINGHLGEKNNVIANIELNDLSKLVPSITGGVFGKLALTGSYTSPRLNLSLDSPRILFDGGRLGKVSLVSNIETKNLVVENIDTSLSTGALFIDKTRYVKNLELKINGSESKHHISLNSSLKDGNVALNLTSGLNKNRTNYSGFISTLDATWDKLALKLKDDLNFDVSFANDLKVTTKAHSWSLNNNLLKFGDMFYAGNDAHVLLDIPSLDIMKFKDYLPKDFSLTQPVTAKADINLKRGDLLGFISVLLPKGDIIYNQEKLGYEEVRAQIDLEKDRAIANANIDFGKSGKIKNKLFIIDPKNKQELSGAIEFDAVDLTHIFEIVPEVNGGSGILDGKASYAGTLSKPLLYGDLHINDMSFFTNYDIGTIEALNTDLKFLGDNAKMKTSFLINKKQGKVTGKVDWSKDMDASIKLKTELLPISLLGYGNGEIELDVDGTFRNDVAKIFGTVNMPTANIRVKELPESSVAASSDVVKIDVDEQGRYVAEQKGQSAVDLKMNINIGPNFYISAMGLRTNLNGSLKIRQKTYQSAIGAEGIIDIVDGKYKAYGQNLIIEKGKISFVGDVNNMVLDVRAIRDPRTIDDENITVGVNITGNTAQPKVELFSEPMMAQSEMLSYLLRGKGIERSTAENSDMSMQLLLGVGLMQTSGYVGSFAEKFGMEDFSLDSKGDGDDTSIEVSAYILPKVQIAYGYGIYNSLSEFRIRYEMFPHFYIEGISAIETAVDALYKFEFDF